MTAALCESCTNLRLKWLDSKPSQMFPELGFITQANAAYDLTAKGAAERRRARHERWRRLVNEQMGAVADRCRAKAHAKAPAKSAPAIVQLPLFDLLEAA